MISLRYLLGLIPDTAAIERKEAKLLKEYNELQAFQQSEELKRYEELKAFVNSPEFKVRKKKILSQKFKDTKEYAELQRFIALKKSPKVKNYFKVLHSHEYAEYEAIQKSGEYADPSSLDEATRKSKRYQAYQKFIQSPAFKLFQSYVESGEHAEYEKLEAYIASDEFRKVKEYMELPSFRKWEQSEEYRQLQEYLSLRKSEKIKWYYAVKDSKKFDRLKTWKVVFEDDFDGQSVNREKWLTRYYWGEVMLHDAYSLVSEKQCNTDGQNLEISGSVLKIILRKEKATGKSWDPEHGFFPRDFDYTGGLINSGKSFAGQHGKIKAKIRVTAGQAGTHAFCLMSQRIVPHLDVFKYENGKFSMNYFWGTDSSQQKIKRFRAKKIENNFFIYEIEWTPEQIIWKINGLEIRRQKDSLPAEPMYLYFGSSLYHDPENLSLPATMEIDWVRWYQKE